MIKAKQVFFLTSNLKGRGFHGDKATILYLTSEYYPVSALSEKLYFFFKSVQFFEVMAA